MDFLKEDGTIAEEAAGVFTKVDIARELKKVIGCCGVGNGIES